MALSPTSLANGLAEIARSFPKNPIEAGKRWAHAYALYAAQAMSPVAAPPASLSANEEVLARALAATWTTSRTAPQTAQQMAAALTAFWLVPPVVFGAGVVTVVAGTSILAAALPGIWLSNQGGKLPADFSAQKLAVAIDAFTHTVIVTTPGAPPIIGPIV